MNFAPKARITGMGSYLPTKILSNEDLEKMVETDDEWIVSRTGIKERRIAASDEYTSTMGVRAAEVALKNAKTAADEVEMILVATMTPDYLCPCTASLIQNELKAVNAGAMDVQAACTGFLSVLSIAKAYVESGMYKKVLVVSSEKMSAFVDYSDRNTCILFGDGASAAVVSNEGEGWHIDAITLGSDGGLADLIIVPAGGARHPASSKTVSEQMHYIKLNGKEVFKNAVRRMTNSSKECLEQARVGIDAISWLVPHQANERIMDALSKNFEVPVYKTVHHYGNTSSSSVAIALDELTKNTEFPSGNKLLLVAFGAGLTWGSAVLEKN